jgi:sirohydrochlorin ferrochelatase
MLDVLEETGLLLIGHGTRSAAGRSEFEHTTAMLRHRLPETPVEFAYLELCEPTIGAAFAQLASTGVRRIIAVPVLLLAAAHARQDIPRQLAAAAARFPRIALTQVPHLGCHEAMLQLSAQRFKQSLAPLDRGGDEEIARATALLMVGRGSSDPDAIAELHRFVELRVVQTPVAHVLTCFLAVARPSLDEAIEQMAAAEAAQIVVQPHLLYQGDLLERLRDTVAAAQRHHPAKRWSLAAHLGPDVLLIEAVLARIADVQ